MNILLHKLGHKTTNLVKIAVDAGIGAIAMAVSTMAISPDQFNLRAGAMKLFKIATMGALLAVCNYIKKSPEWTQGEKNVR